MKKLAAALIALTPGIALALDDPSLTFSQAPIELPSLSLLGNAKQFPIPMPFSGDGSGAWFSHQDSSTNPSTSMFAPNKGFFVPKSDIDPKMLIPVNSSCDPKLVKEAPLGRMAK